MAKFELDEEAVRTLAELLQETGLSEIEYEVEGSRIRVSRAAMVVHASSHAAGHAPPSGPPLERSSASGQEEDLLPADAVTSPMVGTAYLSAEPGAKPFVALGETVVEGDTLLIIEAMKVMNHIPSPKSGKVARVLVTDGQPVEFGEPLFVIE